MWDKAIAVSVVVPVYNCEKYIHKCLNSIVNQTLKNIEIIIIDDGSTDRSADICQSFASKDRRIVYYRKENEGLAAARQDGMSRAKGKYVGFVDSDDWLEPNMYQRMVSAAEEANADIVFCNCFFDDEDIDRVYLEPGTYDRGQIEKKILPRTLSGISSKGSNDVIRWSNCLRIYRMDLIRENGISFQRSFRRSQDLQLTFETTLHANTYVSINDEYLYHNRTQENQNSLSRGYTKNYWNLIRPLIDVLYQQVFAYKKQDLSEQMHLCAYFFAVSGVKNEYECKGNSFWEKLKKIDGIAKDEVIQAALPHVKYELLNDYYKAIYQGLKTKKSVGVYWHYSWYNFRKDTYMPIKRKIINHKVLGRLYAVIKRLIRSN